MRVGRSKPCNVSSEASQKSWLRENRENQMAFYKIKALYEYEGVVEGNTQDEAEKAFLADLNSHYSGTKSIDFEEVCGDCERELDADGSCFECRDEE